jgi:hypothetical protein
VGVETLNLYNPMLGVERHSATRCAWAPHGPLFGRRLIFGKRHSSLNLKHGDGLVTNVGLGLLAKQDRQV